MSRRPQYNVRVYPHTLGIIGLGAIGASLAWRAREVGITRVLGWDRDLNACRHALERGMVHETTPSPRELVGASDLIVLAAPPAANVRLLAEWAGQLGTDRIVTDVGSVKGPIVQQAIELGLHDRFVGSHPLAGTHREGIQGAQVDLLVACIVYVCPAGTDQKPIDRVITFWREVFAATPTLVDPTTHDEQLAWTSHLPQTVASALAHTMSARAGMGHLGTGARDTTRVAASSERMWTDILMANADAVLAALEAFEGSLAQLRSHIANRDETAIHDWLARAATWRREIDA